MRAPSAIIFCTGFVSPTCMTVKIGAVELSPEAYVVLISMLMTYCRMKKNPFVKAAL